MQVVATAGHVDHGKSTLVRALTGMEPDRWAEERRRGMTIDLGFAWTTLPTGERIAFVDVPGHERFVGNMLAGVGPVAAVMFVVAADEGWMPQAAEHLAALDALAVRHGLLVITRCDLAAPDKAAEQARRALAGTSLAGVPEVAVSGRTGAGLAALAAALGRLARSLPAADPGAPVRLWIDRAFTVAGAGTVVTGTLGAGTVARGDALLLAGRPVRVRGLQTLGEERDRVPAVARVAVNLRGVPAGEISRGMALLTPGRWTAAATLDVALDRAAPALPARLTLHLGSAAVPARVRPLGDRHARLALTRPLPFHLGDRALLRDPGRRQVVAGVTVLDLDPPPLTGRGAAAARARELAAGVPDGAAFLARRGLARRAELLALGLTPPGEPVVGDWLADPGHWRDLSGRLARLVHAHAAGRPLAPGVPFETARALLGLPDLRLVPALVRPPLRVRDGRVHGPRDELPASVAAAVERLLAELTAAPFRAPTADRLAELGLTAPALAAAARAGALLRLAGTIVLAPGADAAAARVLAGLAQPFTVSDACRALGSTRRVVIPLLEHLDRTGRTRRLDAGLRTVRAAVPAQEGASGGPAATGNAAGSAGPARPP